MNKKFLFYLMSTLMVAVFSLGLTSCSKDEDDNVSQTTDEEKKYWITGLVRGPVDEYHSNTHDNSQGQNYTYRTMSIIEFRKDFTALQYELFSTESVEFLKRTYTSDGKWEYDGTWTVMEGHPEWSYFNGTRRTDLFPGSCFEFEQINPEQYTYTLDLDENLVYLYKKGRDWPDTYYLNLNPSKTSWSELWDGSRMYLKYIIWNPNDPLDNNKFDKSNNQ